MNVSSGDKEFYTYNAEHRFVAMYPLLARQILDDYGQGITSLLDIGTGGGALLIELAKISSVNLIGLDHKDMALTIARENMAEHEVPLERVRFMKGDVCSIPLPDNSVDVIISRGSIPFWDDMAGAFTEIYRVLAPGGATFIGCGFSRYQSKEEVAKMRPEWSQKGTEDPRNAWKEEGRIPNALRDAGLKDYRIMNNEYGIWVEIRKPRQG